jgi:hypothetical protein
VKDRGQQERKSLKAIDALDLLMRRESVLASAAPGFGPGRNLKHSRYRKLAKSILVKPVGRIVGEKGALL